MSEYALGGACVLLGGNTRRRQPMMGQRGWKKMGVAGTASPFLALLPGYVTLCGMLADACLASSACLRCFAGALVPGCSGTAIALVSASPAVVGGMDWTD